MNKLTALVAVAVLALAGCGGSGDSGAAGPTQTPAVESSATPGQQTAVPDVTGLLGADAATRLADADMMVTFIAMSDGAELKAVDAASSPVIQTYPKAGADVHSDRAVSVFVGTDTRPLPTVSASAPAAALDLVTDAGLCAADAEMTNLELNDAIAPLLGYSPVRDERTVEQDDAIRSYKNAAFTRACPERAS